VHIVYVADAPRVGGAERYLGEVVAGALGAGHSATVIAPQAEVLADVYARAPDVATLRAGSDRYASAATPSARVRALLPAAAHIARAVHAAEPDIVHVNNGGYPGSDLCRLAPMLARVRPAVMSVHSLPWERTHSDPRLQAVVDRALWRSIDAVAGATQVVGSALIDRRGLPPDRFHLLPYGMPRPGGEHEAGPLRARLCPAGELLIGMVAATADEGKGHAVLLEALHQMHEPTHTVIVGADPGPAFAGEPGVTLTGRVPSVGPYLHAIDVLVVPSTQWESLPLVILEAMAAGKPVFGSRLAGIPEAVTDGETGRLFEPGDVATLAAALDDAARDPARLPAMGRSGLARWEHRYSPERMVGGVLGLYDSLAGR